MTSKKKVSNTTAKSKPTLIPKLRFPEFCVAQGWETTILGDHTTKTDTRNKGGKSYPVYSINNEIGFTPQSEQFEGVDSEKRGYDIAQYKLIESKTFAYNPARINVGSLGYSGELNNIIVSSLYVCFQSKPDTDDEFLLHYFKTSGFKRSVNNHVEGGIRSYLFYENFARIEIPLPSFKEQRKIASCLSSLDTLITAHAQKLNALKTYKKGLMQQLFPREGETVPRLRFPEFANAGEWGAGTLDDVLLAASNGLSLPQSADNTGYKVTRIETISAGTIDLEKIGFVKATQDISSYLLNVGDILFSNINSVAHIGKSVYVDNDYGLYHGMNLLRLVVDRHKCDPKFLFYLINTGGIRESFRERANKAVNQASINQTELGKTLVAAPSIPEQQRIASCLTSLDDLIATQTQKLDDIKTHKNGLMQGLFPKQQEVAS